MSLERLAGLAATHPHDGVDATPHDLQARLQAALQQPAPLQELDPEDAVERFIRNLYANEFLAAMMFDDEEKTGTKPEPWY